MLTVVHTSYRWLAPRLLAQAGGDIGRSQIGVSWGKQWLVLSMAEEPPLSSYTSAALRNLSTSDAFPRPSGVLYCPHWLHLTGVLCTVFTSKLGCVSACIAGVQLHNILVPSSGIRPEATLHMPSFLKLFPQGVSNYI